MDFTTAIFGYNNIAQRHLRGLSLLLGNRMPERVSVSGRNTEKATEMTQEYGELSIYKDYRKLLEEKKPNLVIVATPNYLHKEMAIAALEAGADVLCEKPLGMNKQEVREMYNAASKSETYLIPAMSMRYSESAIWLKQQSREEFKKWDFFRGEAKYLRGQHIPGAVGFLNKDQAGGGALLDLGVHILDLALWLLDDDVVEVKGITRSDPAWLVKEAKTTNDYGQAINLEEMSVEYEAEAELYFRQGSTLSLHVSWAGLHPEAKRGKEIDEEAPFFRLTDRAGRQIVWSIKKGVFAADTYTSYISTESQQERYNRQIEHVARVVTGQEPPSIKEQDMSKLHRAIDAIYLSASQGGKVIAL